jgi:hypothetical protein
MQRQRTEGQSAKKKKKRKNKSETVKIIKKDLCAKFSSPEKKLDLLDLQRCLQFSLTARGPGGQRANGAALTAVRNWRFSKDRGIIEKHHEP